MKPLILFALILSIGSLQAQSDLTLMIDNIPNAETDVTVRVYEKGTFLLDEKSEAVHETTVSPKGNRASVTISGLEAGKYYAVAVFSDYNGNGTLDMTWNGRPVEAYGYTGLGKTNGAPSFSDAAFELGPETRALLVSMQKGKKNASTVEPLTSK